MRLLNYYILIKNNNIYQVANTLTPTHLHAPADSDFEILWIHTCLKYKINLKHDRALFRMINRGNALNFLKDMTLILKSRFLFPTFKHEILNNDLI